MHVMWGLIQDITLSDEDLCFPHIYFSVLDPVRVHVLNWDMSYMQVTCPSPQCLEPELGRVLAFGGYLH